MKSTCVAMQASPGCVTASVRTPAPAKAQVWLPDGFLAMRGALPLLPPLHSCSRIHAHVI